MSSVIVVDDAFSVYKIKINVGLASTAFLYVKIGEKATKVSNMM